MAVVTDRFAGAEDLTASSARTQLLRLLCSVAESVLAAAVDLADVLSGEGEVSVLVHRDGHWTVLAGNAGVCGEDELAAVDPASGGTRVTGRIVSGGGVAIALATTSDVAGIGGDVLRQACVWLAQAWQAGISHEATHDAAEEAGVQRAVADQILTVRDLDQVLLSITNQTLRMLEADICGVFLREGEEVRMRSCTGHRVIDTARLRMRRGQGVAGMVFDTGEVTKVDSYLDDRTISQDFMSLAVQEDTRSALAAPLRAHGEVVGVLEVWRRRHSVFTERDVRRLMSLADLATIAIENARLYEQQRRMLAELRETQGSLQHQVDLLHRSSALQRSLIQAVLDNTATPAAIAHTVAEEMHCRVAVLSADGQIEAVHPQGFDASALAAHVAKWPKGASVSARQDTLGGTRYWAAGVHAGGNQFGVVCLVGGEESDEAMEIACGQAAMACSLAQAEQHAASCARAEAFEQILWDLLHGPSQHRMAARSRAQQMGVRLKGPHRVIYGVFDNLTELAHQHGWDTSTSERVRRDALRAIRDCPQASPLKLASVRGDWIVGVVAAEDRATAHELMTALNTAACTPVRELKMSWGVSTVRGNAHDYPSAYNEAKTALAAARRLATGSVSLYDELGIVRLLLGSSEDPDYQSFIAEVTAPLVEYDQRNDGSLVTTLRTFFDADCSQKNAAKRMFVHPKTLSYRLDRIKELTGLDLGRHADRMRADLALRLLEVTEAGDAVEPA
ncbi:MAG TPA: helix-turn-helix domain-containing protein [Streptosporangiaceae bacterium]|jgi:sugar diacid utilization regulator/GAF domain-containing protein